MATNKIIKNNLEPRAIDLKGDGKTFDEIATILSEESKNKITLSSVFRFFESNDKAVAQSISKNDKLKAKVADAEISTINGRITVIEKLISVFETCESIHDIQVISREIKEHYDSLDKCRGKWINTAVNIDNSKIENSVNVVLHLPRKDHLPGIK
jgi:hypothetical protein